MPLPDSDSYATFGGTKVDYGTSQVDASTDRKAAEVNQVFCNVAMSTRTLTRAWVRFTAAASPVVASWDAVWKGATSTVPTITLGTAGVYTITFPATVLDEMGTTHSLNFRAATGGFEGASFGNINFSVLTPNTVTVYCGTSAGAANNMTGLSIVVDIL
jgi:hypothetical protein